MAKYKISSICFLFFLLSLLVFEINRHEQIKQKLVLAQEIQNASQTLMLKLALSPAGSLKGLVLDGKWHTFKINSQMMSVDHITALYIRCQKSSPDIVEVKIEAKDKVSMSSYLKVRLHR